MNEQENTATRGAIKNDDSVIRRVTVCSIFLVGVLAAGSWYFAGWPFARSLLIGGVLVNASFWLMQKDARRLVRKVGESEVGTGINVEKTRFILKTFARLIVLGLLLFVLASRYSIDAIGLTLGFATVMVSVVIIGMRVGNRWMPSKV